MSDPDYITETDMIDWPGNAPWVDCELGHIGCTGGDSADEMMFDTGWICRHCWGVQQAEWDDYERVRRGW